ncbi:MAG: type II secretion system F family protein [Thermogutta sp.]
MADFPLIDLSIWQDVLRFWNEWGLSILAFVSIVSLAIVFRRIMAWRRNTKANSGLEKMPPVVDPEMDDAGAFGALTPALAAQIPESAKETHDFHLLLRQAGLHQPSARYTIYAFRFLLLVTPLIIAGICAVLADRTWTGPILIAGGFSSAVLSIIPRMYVFLRRRRRYEEIRSGLADTIDMLGMCLTGGLGLIDSLEHVAGQMEAYPALAAELRTVKRQAEVGSFKLALEDLTQRVDLPEIRQLCAVLSRGTQLGSQLAGSLSEHADHLRVALRQSALARANKAPVKLVLPILFCLAPAALIILTAPAFLELRQFFDPSVMKSTTAKGVTFGTNSVIEAIRELDQRPNPDLPTFNLAVPTPE